MRVFFLGGGLEGLLEVLFCLRSFWMVWVRVVLERVGFVCEWFGKMVSGYGLGCSSC